MAEIKTPRRYYLHKRLVEQIYFCDGDAAAVWQSKQEAEPGTPLPDDFAHHAELTELGYTAREDLDGADAYELENAGLTRRQATEVLAAFAAL